MKTSETSSAEGQHQVEIEVPEDEWEAWHEDPTREAELAFRVRAPETHVRVRLVPPRYLFSF